MDRKPGHVVVADGVWLCVEMVEDITGYFWWRWMVRGGFEHTKEERSMNSILWRRSGFGGHKPMRRKKRKMC